MQIHQVETQSRSTRWSPAPVARAITWATWIVGVLLVSSVLVPPVRHRLRPGIAEWFGLPKATLIGVVITAVAGVGLIMLSTGLRRRKRRAWQVCVALSALLVIAHLTPPHEIGVGLLSAGLLIGLIATRRQFIALPDPVGKFAAASIVAELLMAGLVLNWLLLMLESRSLEGSPSIWERMQHAGLALIGLEGPVDFRVNWLDDLTAGLGLTFGIGALLAGGYFLLRSAEPKMALSDKDESQLRELLDRHGRADSLGYFVLRRDKSAIFSPTNKSAIGYRVLAGVALASGDPLGDVEAWPGACIAFLEKCRLHGWVPAVVGCSEQGARVWTRFGLSALELGDEAVVDAPTFSLEGRAMRGIRQAVCRLRRSGYQVRVRRLSELTADEAFQLSKLAESWRGTSTERGYSMALSRFGDPSSDGQCVVVTAELEGQVRGLLQFVPWGQDGLSLDLMRRDRDVPDNGLNELMIAELFASCPQYGIERVSLNFAILRAAFSHGERLGAGPMARLWRRLLHVASRWWQIETLYRFNAKFGPAWVPRYVVFGTLRDLPRVAVAAFEAEGFGGRPPALLRMLQR